MKSANEGTFRVVEGGAKDYKVREANLTHEQKVNAVDVWFMCVESWLSDADEARKRKLEHGGQDSKGYTDWHSALELNLSDIALEEVMNKDNEGYKMLMKEAKRLGHELVIKKTHGGKRIRVKYSYWKDFQGDESEPFAMAA